MKPETVSIHIIRSGPHRDDSAWLSLSAKERLRATSFVFKDDAANWIARRAAMRRILGQLVDILPAELPIVVSDDGKPGLAEPFDHLHFSLTHSKDLALLAVCVDGQVGVDVEPSGRASDLTGCESTFCHPSEIASLPVEPLARASMLLDIWTAKEALLKALGTGLTHPPETVRIHSDTARSDIPIAGIDEQAIHRLNHPALAGYRAAVSAPRSVNRIEFMLFEASTYGTPPSAS